jgi:protein tyrosine/serine phosphatase
MFAASERWEKMLRSVFALRRLKSLLNSARFTLFISEKNMRCLITIILFFTIFNGGEAAEPRNPDWAAPLLLEGVPNLHKINENLYRSAQPAREGMKNLEKLGIRTIINLRAFHSDSDEIKGTRLNYRRLHIKTWHIEDEDVIRVLKIVSNPKDAPYLIHCQHGADRTGLMCAMYRIVFQGWTKNAAIEELKNGGYGFHPIWTNIIKYIENIDIEGIKNQIRPSRF